LEVLWDEVGWLGSLAFSFDAKDCNNFGVFGYL
jgi:hypothetical protein